MLSLGAMSGATRANDFPRQADGSGQADGDHASSRTDPDNAERQTGIYGSEGPWRGNAQLSSSAYQCPYPGHSSPYLRGQP
jgi:hypothetical protein